MTIGLFIISACGSDRPAAPERRSLPTLTPTSAPAEEAATPLPTDTPIPITPAQLQPANTPELPPTDTPLPIPTDTPLPVPTDTPLPIPTDTPIPPPPAPAPPTDTPIPVPTDTPVPAPPAPTDTPVPAAPPDQAGAGCDCSNDLYNCTTHFSTHAEAQACYEHCMAEVGYDVHELDGNDQDGLACESLP